MSRIQLIISPSYQEAGSSQPEMKKIIDTNSKKTNMLELFDKNFRLAMKKILQLAITNNLETNEN